jgi:hypothetical protein
MSYKKKHSGQQYALERKKVLSSVESKVKQATLKGKPKMPKSLIATAAARAKTKAEEAVEALSRGQPATLHYKSAGIKITTKVRYETMKTEPLIKTVHMADGKLVFKRFVGPSKQEVWVDAEGKEHNKQDVKLMQEKAPGKYEEIKVSKTKDIVVEAVDPRVSEPFQPYSFIEMWGEDEGSDDALRDFAYDLAKNKQVGAIKEFSHGFGKVYVGFVRPIMSPDGKTFTLEVMISENKKKFRRWMASEPGKVSVKEKKVAAAEIPKMW